MKRRKFVKIAGSLTALSPLIHMTSLYPQSPQLNEEVVKVKVGSFKCTLFRDSMFNYLPKDFFINATPEAVTAAMSKYQPDGASIHSPFIALLIQAGKQNILIDTGVGYSEKPVVFRGKAHEFKGSLHRLLQQEQISPDEITDVVITHLHPDHIGGIFSDEKLNFPKARFHIHEAEWNYWHSASAVNQPAMFGFFIERNITKLKAFDLHVFKGDFIELLPGVTSVTADGHTPGQIVVLVHSGKEQLLYISDAFLHPLHIENLDWQTNYDLDHNRAKNTRIKLLDLADKENAFINAFHFKFPGLGRVHKQAGNWTWNYTDQ